MLSTGMTRQLDALGRIVLPKELRDTMGIDIRDPIEFFQDENMIIMKKYEPGCTLCGDVTDTINFKGKKVCLKCKSEIMAEAR